MAGCDLDRLGGDGRGHRPFQAGRPSPTCSAPSEVSTAGSVKVLTGRDNAMSAGTAHEIGIAHYPGVVGIPKALARIKRADTPGGPGYFDAPTCLGMSLEAGNVWQSRGEASLDNTQRVSWHGHVSRSVYLATGFDTHGHQAFYLFLGRAF